MRCKMGLSERWQCSSERAAIAVLDLDWLYLYMSYMSNEMGIPTPPTFLHEELCLSRSHWDS